MFGMVDTTKTKMPTKEIGTMMEGVTTEKIGITTTEIPTQRVGTMKKYSCAKDRYRRDQDTQVKDRYYKGDNSQEYKNKTKETVGQKESNEPVSSDKNNKKPQTPQDNRRIVMQPEQTQPEKSEKKNKKPKKEYKRNIEMAIDAEEMTFTDE